MTCRPAFLLAGMIALAATAISPALADVYYVTYTGTASGTDTNGVFGAAGATLSGAAFTATYTYDPVQFGNAVVASGPGELYVYGGSHYGAGVIDPILSAAITINGHTYSQGSSYIGEQKPEANPELVRTPAPRERDRQLRG